IGNAYKIDNMHFMLQKEVVDRMCAAPGDEDYGRLTVALAARAEVAKLFVVGPGAFNPAPKVHSAIVRLVPRPPPFEIADLQLFDRLVTAAFGQRRKTLANGLKGLLSTAQIAEAGIDPGIRAERLSAAEFASLTAVAAGVANKNTATPAPFPRAGERGRQAG
ncbi:MAG: ribosomal RNA small subunit methyltransferase A, partial [Stenotrophobium sp.]